LRGNGAAKPNPRFLGRDGATLIADRLPATLPLTASGKAPLPRDIERVASDTGPATLPACSTSLPAPLPTPISHAKIDASSWAQSMRMRLKAGPIILLFALAPAACSEAVVTPNRTNPAFIGTYGPGGSGWH
jgi:hypothetical protein